MNVYDFDNTIYDGESAYDFFIAFLKVRPSLVKRLPKVLLAFAKYKLGLITTEIMMRDYAPLITKIFGEYDDWEGFVKKFWDEHDKKIKSFYSVTRRSDDVILTASPNVTMEEIARRLGVKHVICSTLDRETGEMTRLCMRERKTDAFFEYFGEDAQIDAFYTDSVANDKFFAQRAKRVYLVKGDKIRQIK